jgi:hypothetical protein
MNTYIAKGGNEKLKKRLVAVIGRLENGERPRYGPDDLAVLCYVRDELDPERIKETRREDDTNLGRLHVAANERLAHYEKEDEDG